MSDTTLSPEAIYFRDRIAELDEEIRDRQSRRAELELAFKAFTDGRSTVNRQRRTRTAGNSIVPPPEPDGNSTADGMALLNTSRAPMAERAPLPTEPTPADLLRPAGDGA